MAFEWVERTCPHCDQLLAVALDRDIAHTLDMQAIHVFILTRRDEMAFEWTQEQYDGLPTHVKKLRALLEFWYNALEDGSAEQWMAGKLTVTEEYADRLVTYLDEAFQREVDVWAHQVGYDAPPGFCRLDTHQRMMLAEEVLAILKEADDAGEREHTTSGGNYLTAIG